MAEKNWIESLRHKMSDFEQTPPEGLLEGIESAMGSAKGKAAGGLLAWLAGRPGLWPVWAMAGVAAAAAAVLFIRTPESTVVSPKATAELVDSTLTEKTDSGMVEEGIVVEEEPSVVEEVIAVPATGVNRKVAQIRQEAPKASVSDEKEEAISQDAPSAPVSDVKEAEIHQDSTNPAQPELKKEQDATESTQPKNRQPDYYPQTGTRVPINRLAKGKTSRLTASLLSGGSPGMNTTVTNTSYGFSNNTGYHDTGNGARPKMAMVSRNKEVQTEISRRQDYQVGLLVGYSFNDRWGIESGVQLTGLSSNVASKTSTITIGTSDKINYIGVPLRLVYYPVKSKSFAAYLSVGPAVEYGLSRTWSDYETASDAIVGQTDYSERPGDWVFSASFNAGLQWQPWRYGAFFIQPGVVGRMVSENSPESFYTDHPVSFQLAAGYKITF